LVPARHDFTIGTAHVHDRAPRWHFAIQTPHWGAVGLRCLQQVQRPQRSQAGRLQQKAGADRPGMAISIGERCKTGCIP
jgi:hypothetical protein